MTEYVFRIHDRRRCGEARGEREGFRRGFGRHEHGCGPEASFERGFGGRREHRHGRGRERMFDAGDLKLVILKLLSEQPSYGYQLIKTMEERLAGGYTPSAGSDLSHPDHAGRRGPGDFRDREQQEGVLRDSGRNSVPGGEQAPGRGIIRAAGGGGKRLPARPLSGNHEGLSQPEDAVVARVSRESVTAEQIRKISEAINAAAKAIDEL